MQFRLLQVNRLMEPFRLQSFVYFSQTKLMKIALTEQLSLDILSNQILAGLGIDDFDSLGWVRLG